MTGHLLIGNLDRVIEDLKQLRFEVGEYYPQAPKDMWDVVVEVIDKITYVQKEASDLKTHFNDILELFNDIPHHLQPQARSSIIHLVNQRMALENVLRRWRIGGWK